MKIDKHISPFSYVFVKTKREWQQEQSLIKIKVKNYDKRIKTSSTK